MSAELEVELARLTDFCNVEDTSAQDVPRDVPLIGPDSPFGLDSLMRWRSLSPQKGYGASHWYR